MVSKQAVTIAVVAIVMLAIGAGIGYGIAGTRVVTVTSPVTLTFYTPLTITATVSTTVTQLQPVMITVTVTSTLTQGVVEAVIRQVVQVDSWRLAVLDVKEATYIKTLFLGTWRYYQAPEGMKIVVIRLRIENAGMEIRYPFEPGELNAVVLVTDANKSYNRAYTYQLKNVYSITSDIEAKAVTYNELDPFTKVAPGSYVEGDIMFLIPQTEKPAKLAIEYQPSPFEPKMVIIIKLS